MVKENTTYVILKTSEIIKQNSIIDFSQLVNHSADHLRYSVNGKKALVSYKGEQPVFLNGKKIYTPSEIEIEMDKNAWGDHEDEGLVENTTRLIKKYNPLKKWFK